MSALSKVLAIGLEKDITPQRSELEILELVDKRRILRELEEAKKRLACVESQLEIVKANLTPEAYLRVSDDLKK